MGNALPWIAAPISLVSCVAHARSPKHSKPVVTISDATRRGYWLVAITCKDRNKLLFDTVCTLADMSYDVYHATVDSSKGIATQEYYIKPRHGTIGEWQDLLPHCELLLLTGQSRFAWLKRRLFQKSSCMLLSLQALQYKLAASNYRLQLFCFQCL